MLKLLSIQNFAIVKELTLHFDQGFHVITGETGAGKSILVKALGLLLGEKASSDIIRAGADYALVSGVFSLEHNASLQQRLAESGIDTDQQELIIRRRISAKSKSQIWLNDSPVTKALLTEVGEHLIDILGQYDHHQLLQEKTHVDFFDFAAGTHSLRDTWQQSLLQFKQRFDAFVQEAEKILAEKKERDFLEFRLQELSKLDPSHEDYTALLAESQKFHRLKDLTEAQNAFHALSDWMEQKRPFSQIKSIFAPLHEIDPAFYDQITDHTAHLNTEWDNLGFRVEEFYSQFDAPDDKKMEQIEERLASYQLMLRKLGLADTKQLEDFYHEMQERMERVDSCHLFLSERIEQLQEEMDTLQKQGKKLSRERKKFAHVLEKKIEQELNELAMKGARFSVQFNPVDTKKALPQGYQAILDERSLQMLSAILEGMGKMAECGLEKPLFLLSANPGETLKPLAKIASGGEVSRIMLALKRVLRSGARAFILVFDEIDAGVSGKVAEMMGAKMKDLAQEMQIICISHLPQVASFADHHYLAYKEIKGRKTQSSIRELRSEESVEEIARLLSGAQITQESRANAKRMKEYNQEVTAH